MSVLSKLKGKPWLRWLGYPAFYNLAFLGGIYLTFPYDALRDRIVAEAEKATGMDVEVEKVRLAGVSGLTLHGLELAEETFDVGTELAPPVEGEVPAEGEVAQPGPQRVRLDEVTARADLFSLVTGKRALKFDVEAFGGDLHGKVVMGDEEQLFEAKGRGIDFGQSPIQALAGLDLVGRISELEIDLRSPGKDFSKADGTIVLKGEELTLNGGEVQMFELPKVVLGNLDGRLEFKEGVADFEQFTIKGADLEARMEGNLRLQPVLKGTSITGKLEIKPSDEWWDRNEMLKTAANFALPAGKDGWRAIRIYGQVTSPKFRPQK